MPAKVDNSKCNACEECSKVCPVTMPDEFQMGLSSRKAIYIPFPQAVPCSYILNMDDCLGNNPIACGKCSDVCEKEAIDFDDADELVIREVGAIVVAIGLAQTQRRRVPSPQHDVGDAIELLLGTAGPSRLCFCYRLRCLNDDHRVFNRSASKTRSSKKTSRLK